MKATEARKRLKECEASLRRLLAEAANEGDYGSVMLITSWAKALAALVGEAGEDSDPSSTNQTHIFSDRVNHELSVSAAPSHRGRRPAAQIYPQFFRRGDELVKVGWSKKDRKEYAHRAPRRAVVAVA